jgi:hypothetical protein
MAPDDATPSIDLDRSRPPLFKSLHREKVSFVRARSTLVQLETGWSAYEKSSRLPSRIANARSDFDSLKTRPGMAIAGRDD